MGLIIRSKLFIIGGVFTGIWAVITLYLAITAVEMEILAALLVLIVGGYLLGAYFLLIVAITAKTKKRKWIWFALFSIWVLIPVFSYAYDEVHSSWYEQKLESTIPTEELVQEVFTEIDQSFVQLPTDFYSYQNQELTIKVDTLEYNFIRHARLTYQEIINEVGQQEIEKIDETMVEDVFGRYFFHVFDVHNGIWNRTTAPRLITVELYYNNEMIFKTTSTDYSNVQGNENLIERIELFYQRLKPEIIDESFEKSSLHGGFFNS